MLHGIKFCLWKEMKWDIEIKMCSSCCSVIKLCLTFCNPMDCSRPGLPVIHYLSPRVCSNSRLLMPSHWCLVVPSNHLILCFPLLPLPLIFPSIRVSSSEMALCIRWPKYWSFSFSISAYNKNSGLISLRIDWFHLLTCQWESKSKLIAKNLNTTTQQARETIVK